MTEPWRKKFIREQRGAYRAATVEKIDTNRLIFDTETNEALPFSEETFQACDIQIQCPNQEWKSVQYYNFDYLRMNEKLIPIEDVMHIRMETALPFAYNAWLEQLSRHSLLKFTQLINDLNYSLFDCIFCHNATLFQNSDCGESINFIFLDNSYIPCSVHHRHTQTFTTKEESFHFTLADGKSYQLLI